MSQYFYNQTPPYCRPFECSELYPFLTTFPSLSFINTQTEDPVTGVSWRPDSIRDGMNKVNCNMYAIDSLLQQFADVYGRYRKNLSLIYTFSSFYTPALTADPPTAFSRPPRVGDVLYFMASSADFPLGAWNYAIATSGVECEALGVISDILTAGGMNCFAITLNGYVSSDQLAWRIPGATYFLSDTDPGTTRTTNPVDPGMISKPIYTAMSNTEIVVDIKRGVQLANYNVWPT
jgi:hypothetical protein